MVRWVWHVKRKFAALHTEYECMPVLLGRTGGGKTRAVEMLTSPLEDLAKKWTLDELSDERCWQDLEKANIGIIEELAGAKRADLEKLKDVITSREVVARVLGTHQRPVYRQATVFIATSNKSVPEMIKDETSARRFWEIRCKDKLDWDAINAIDYSALWGCVKATDPCPLQGELLAEIERLQHSKLRHRTDVELWVEDCGLQAEPDAFTSTADLCAAYNGWAVVNEAESEKSRTLGAALSKLGFKTKRAGGGKRGFLAKLPR